MIGHADEHTYPYAILYCFSRSNALEMRFPHNNDVARRKEQV